MWGLLAAYQNSGTRDWQPWEVMFLTQIGMQFGLAISQAEYLEQVRLKSEQLTQIAEQEKALTKIVNRIRQSLSADTILKIATLEVRQLLKCDRVAVYRFNSKWSGEFVAESVGSGWIRLVGPDLKTVWEDTYLQQTQGGRYAKGENLAVNDIYQAGHSPCYVEMLEQFEVRAYTIVPVLLGEKLWGLLAAYQNSSTRDWQPWEVSLLARIGDQFGLALQQAEYLQQLQDQSAKLTEVAAREKAAKELMQQTSIKLLAAVRPALDGDLTVRAPITEDELSTIADAYNNTLQALREIVIQVQQAAQQVVKTSSSSNTSLTGLTTLAQQQSEEITVALSEVQQMVDSTQAVASSAELVQVAVQQANQTVESGEAAMNRTVEAIQAIRETVAQTSKKIKRLGESSQKISKVVNLISNFATQTNVLALNAAIEATRAGEYGKGFAVVADEVRSLSRQSAAATIEIEKLVQEIQDETGEVAVAMQIGIQQVIEGTNLVGETRQNLNAIVAATAEINQLLQMITKSTHTQMSQSVSVTTSMKDVAEIANKTFAEANEISAMFQQLSGMAKELLASAGKFKVNHSPLMITDPSIREQGYIYFLSEAPELLQTIEQELFSLGEDYSIAKVHTLMRATHTIKGGSANIGLDVINKVAHSLEDVFKALYNPDVKIDAELRTLIFQGFECLQLPLMAEFSNTSIDSDEILERAASVFALLQEKLGNAFSDENYIPTSEELGFDLVLSIFETGVTQRLESITNVIQNPPDNTEITDFLRSQAEVFLGLAQSLNLPGFEAIAQTTLTALEAHPDLALEIAEIALADWQQAREAVLAGDRTSGGKPSTALQKLTTEATDDIADVTTSLRGEVEEFYKFLIKVGQTKVKAQFYLKVTRYILGWLNHELEIPYEELRLALLISQNEGENNVNDPDNWLFNFLDFMQEEEDSHSLYLYRRCVILTVILAAAKFLYQRNPNDITMIQILKTKISTLVKESKNYPQVTTQEKKWLESPKLQKLLEIKEISTSVSSQVGNHLMEEIWGENVISSIDDEEVNSDELKNSVGALTVNELVATDMTEKIPEVHCDSITNNSQQVENKSQNFSANNSRQPSFVRVDVEGLNSLNYLAGELLIYQKRRTLHDQQLQEIIERLFQQIQRHHNSLTQLGEMPLQMQSFNTLHRHNIASVNFDALEMDEYTEVHLKLHEATEETLQLEETLESLDLILRQATLVHEKQQHLTVGIIDNLVEARMSPLGNILNRFPQMIQNLGNVYGKSVELRLIGTQVLVDKAITEKLYDPLLQLVRNAFDHGIEPPEIRFKRDKPEQGLIEICAYHQGSQTIIEVRDDGHGLNFDKIRSKAIELNLISTNDAARGDISSLTQDELLEFLFLPGFSTANRVSEISGRGMGLDIVRSQLQALNGSISVQSLPNQGTTFILKIPFSMTTDQLMLIQAGGSVYGLLLETIERVLLPGAVAIKELEFGLIWIQPAIKRTARQNYPTDRRN